MTMEVNCDFDKHLTRDHLYLITEGAQGTVIQIISKSDCSALSIWLCYVDCVEFVTE